MTILPISASDTSWVKQVLTNLGSSIEDTNALLGYIAKEGDRNVGLITYVILVNEVHPESDPGQARMTGGSTCQIISLNSLTPGKGIGSALYEKVEQKVKTQGCKKILTKIDNVTKDFFLKKGFRYSKNGVELEKAI